jgi:hypothetical protein
VDEYLEVLKRLQTVDGMLLKSPEYEVGAQESENVLEDGERFMRRKNENPFWFLNNPESERP